MRSLAFIVVRSFINFVKEIFRTPAKLVMYGLILVVFVGVLILSLFNVPEAGEILPLYWLEAILFALVALFLVIAIQKGLTAGDQIFEMSDVNLLFVSPVNPRLILMYGLVKLLKISFLAGFFILFQSSSLAIFGVNFGGLLVVFAVFIVSIIVQSMLSLVIYSTTNGKPVAKRVVRIITVLLFVPFLAYAAVQIGSGADMISALANTIQSPFFSGFPIAGWAAAGTTALLAGDMFAGLAWLGLLLLVGVGLVVFLLTNKVDYYEDVLVATETAFEKKRAAESGDVQAATATNARVTVRGTGIRGVGASTFFYKHLREDFRENRFGFFGLYTAIMFVCIIAARLIAGDALDPVTVLQVLMWIQLFMVGSGRGMKELFTHYLFMIPDGPFVKLVWNNLETVLKTLLESVLFFAIPGILRGDNPLVVVGCMLVYTLFTYAMLGLNYLSMRVTATSISQGLLAMIYVVFALITMVPGIAGALVAGFTIGGVPGTVMGLLILSGWELVLGTVFFFFARNVLRTSDIITMKLA